MLLRSVRRAARPRRRCCARSPRWRPPAGPAGLADGVPWPPRVLLVGASPDDRASIARAAAREGVGEALAYAPALAAAGPGRPGPRRPGGDPAGRLRGGRPAGHRGARLRDAGRRVGGRAAPRAGRRRPGSSSSRATPTGWPSRWPRSGPTTASTPRSPRLPRRGRAADRRTWADVARETRAVYAEVGIRRRRDAEVPRRLAAGVSRAWPMAPAWPAAGPSRP